MEIVDNEFRNINANGNSTSIYMENIETAVIGNNRFENNVG